LFLKKGNWILKVWENISPEHIKWLYVHWGLLFDFFVYFRPGIMLHFL
jgi:hypothetical protein